MLLLFPRLNKHGTKQVKNRPSAGRGAEAIRAVVAALMLPLPSASPAADLGPKCGMSEQTQLWGFWGTGPELVCGL
jgi:hypothetical protein